MSMILDALKRADRERRQQDLEVPTLDSNHGERPPGARRWRPWLIGSGLVGFAVLLAGGVTLIRTPWQAESPSIELRPETGTAQTQPEQTGPRDGEQPAANPQQAAIEALYQTQENSQPEQDSGRKLTREQIANLYRQAIEDTPEQAPGNRKSQTEAQTEEGTKTKESAQARENAETPATSETPAATVALKATASEIPTDATSSVPASSQTNLENTGSAQTSNNDRQPTPSGVPHIHTLPQSVQRNIPSINYQEHHYRPGGGSWVRLNRERKQVGDRISPDLRLESIDQEGVVLNYQGRSFRLKALNSWINM